MISVPVDVVAQGARDLRELFGSVGHREMVSAAMKRDQRNGLFEFLEVNARL